MSKRCLMQLTCSVSMVVLASCASVSTHQNPSPTATGASVPSIPATTERVVVNGPPQSSDQALTLEPGRAGAPARKVLSPRVSVDAATTVQLSGLPDSKADRNTMVAHFIDVGQGDATLLEFECGAVLIDTGGENTSEVSGPERLEAYLQDFFVRRPDLMNTLNLVVLSHPHADHTAGVKKLVNPDSGITIRNVLDNGATAKGSGISGQKALQKYARDNAQVVGYVGLAEADIPTVAGVTNKVIDPVKTGCNGAGGVDPKITALWGRVDLDAPWANDANNDSVVLRVDFGSASFLFMGDLEEEGIEALLDAYSPDPSILNGDVLKVGHHGSRNGTTADLVAAVTPKIAVAPAGDSALSEATFSAFSFGHPHQNAVAMLSDTSHDVSLTRPQKSVRVGVRGRNPSTGEGPQFTNISLTRAVYSNGWDGNIAIVAKHDGTLKVESEF